MLAVAQSLLYPLRVLFLVFLFLLMGNVGTYGKKAPISAEPATFLRNFNEPNLENFVQRLAKAKKSEQIHIVQLGDSHTAADIFSGHLRQLMQRRYGNGGVGFIPAYPVKGIRSDLISVQAFEEPRLNDETATETKKNLDAKGKEKPPEPIWQLISSRNQSHAWFPLGGYLVDLKDHPGELKVAPYTRSPIENTKRKYNFSLLYHSPADNSLMLNNSPLELPGYKTEWQWSEKITDLNFPIQLQLPITENLLLGGMYLTHSDGKGVVLSSLGINGATVSFLDKWQRSWISTLKALQPDLLIVAYGTNEAFSDKLSLNEYKQALKSKVRLLRKEFPEAVILLVGPPDSIKHQPKKEPIDCEQPYVQRLRKIIAIQESIAEQENTLFWDWQAAMGGSCSIVTWRDDGYARNDLVHMTREGYQKSAGDLMQDLNNLFLPYLE